MKRNKILFITQEERNGKKKIMMIRDYIKEKRFNRLKTKYKKLKTKYFFLCLLLFLIILILLY